MSIHTHVLRLSFTALFALTLNAGLLTLLIGIPIVNCGPGGKTGDEDTLKETIASLN